MNAVIDNLLNDHQKIFYLRLLCSRMVKKKRISSKIAEMLNELIDSAEKRILSIKQMQIFMSKIVGVSYASLRRKFNLSCDTVVERILKRTATGKRWDDNMKGGGDRILSDIDMVKFIDIIKERENDVNCLSTCQANKIVQYLQTERIYKAKELLYICHCDKIAAKLHIKEPDSTWLTNMSKRCNIAIVPRQDLERARRIACDDHAIREFFSKHSNLLNRDPRLIFNMDETMVSSNKKFKVLVTKGRIPLTEAPPIHPHITACVTIGAHGSVLKPLFILPNKKRLKELKRFEGLAYFASTPTGWMNGKIFTYWAYLFLAQISKYRLDLPPNLRNQRILLYSMDTKAGLIILLLGSLTSMESIF